MGKIMENLSEMIDRWESSNIGFMEVEHLVNLLIIENHSLNNVEEPLNIVCGTHWAIMPDGGVLIYLLDDEVKLWAEHSREWIKPMTIPYTLHPFDP